MFLKKITFPCKSFQDKEKALENIKTGSGQVQTYRIDYDKNEIHISVIVEPENEKKFLNFIDSLEAYATIISGTRGGKGPVL